MIESIKLENEASYRGKPTVIKGLKQRNYFFGSNGVGKSTIGRLVANPSAYPSCSVAWSDGKALETFVYNRDFVAENFDGSDDLQGVFTLGRDSKEAKAQIADERKRLAELDDNMIVQQKELRRLGVQTATLDSDLAVACWEVKKKHDLVFKDAFKGYRNSKEDYRDQVLAQRNAAATLLPLDVLKERAAIVFGDPPVAESLVPAIDAAKLIRFESDPLLAKRVVGKADVDIAKMIQALGSSDWVRTGRSFLPKAEGACPFCQQQLPAQFETKLNDYFDETFELDARV